MLNNLAPLTRSPAELYYAKYEELRKLIPQDFFDQSEEELIKAFDSRKTYPSLIFLGLDESRKEENAFAHKIYSGAPCFAVDVTPKGSEAQQSAAKDIISAMESKGLSFFQTRIVTTFTPDEGTLNKPSSLTTRPNYLLLGLFTHHVWNSRYICSGPRFDRLEQP